jgi:hypothetical protein
LFNNTALSLEAEVVELGWWFEGGCHGFEDVSEESKWVWKTIEVGRVLEELK